MSHIKKRLLSLLLCLIPYASYADGMTSQINGNGTNLATGSTAYLCVAAGRNRAWITTENQTSCVSPVAGTLRNLYVKLSGASGTGSREFTLMVNGSPSTLTTTITNGTTNNDTTHSVSISANDTVSLRQVTTGTLNAVEVAWVMEFSAGNANEFPIFATSATTTVAGGATRFLNLQGDGAYSTTESGVQQIIPTAGALSRLFVQTSAAPSSGQNIAFVVMVNGSPSILTTTVSDLATSNSDTVNSVSVNAGDKVSIRAIASASAATTRFRGGVKFAPTIDGETPGLSIVSGQTQNTTTFSPFSGGSFQSSTENKSQQLVLAGTLKKLYVGASANIGGAGQTFTSTAMINGVGSALTCQIASGAATCNDTSNFPALVTGDLVDIRTVASATTGSVTAALGSVILMTQPTATPTVTPTPTATPVANGGNRLLKGVG